MSQLRRLLAIWIYTVGAAQISDGVRLRSRPCLSQHGQIRPQQLKIDHPRREVAKLKTARTISSKAAVHFAGTRFEVAYLV